MVTDRPTDRHSVIESRSTRLKIFENTDAYILTNAHPNILACSLHSLDWTALHGIDDYPITTTATLRWSRQLPISSFQDESSKSDDRLS